MPRRQRPGVKGSPDFQLRRHWLVAPSGVTTTSRADPDSLVRVTLTASSSLACRTMVARPANGEVDVGAASERIARGVELKAERVMGRNDVLGEAARRRIKVEARRGRSCSEPKQRSEWPRHAVRDGGFVRGHSAPTESGGLGAARRHGSKAS